MKFLRCVRLDESDTKVYDLAAEAGELAVPGSFSFLDDDAKTLTGQRAQAFASGFLGTQSFGWCTLVEIAEINDDDLQGVIDRLAHHFVSAHGAPHIAAALPVAAEEAEYASLLCEYELGTLLAVERELGADGVVERLKVIRQSAAAHDNVRLWEHTPSNS